MFEWSFFYPISMFFIYLSVQWGAQISSFQLPGNILNTALVFHYIVMAVLLLASVMVGKQMGIYGAAAVIGVGIAGRKMLLGYAGRRTKSLALRAAAPVAHGLSRVAAAPGRIPYVGGLFRAAVKPLTAPLNTIVRARDKEREEARKKYAGLADTAGARTTYEGIVNPRERRLFREAMVEQGKAKLFYDYEMRGDYSRYRKDNNTKAIRGMEAYDPSYAAEGLATEAEQRAAINQAVQRVSVDDIHNKMRGGAIKNAMVQDAMLLVWGEQKLEAALENFGTDLIAARNAAYERFVTNVHGGNENVAIDELRNRNKTGLKFHVYNPLMAADTSAGSMAVKARTNIDNQNAERIRKARQIARDAVEARHRAAGTHGTPAEVTEIAAAEADAERTVRRIDIR